MCMDKACNLIEDEIQEVVLFMLVAKYKYLIECKCLKKYRMQVDTLPQSFLLDILFESLFLKWF